MASIVGLDKIQASSLKLDDAGLAALGARGFAIGQQHLFPNFAYGYHSIYVEDLPVYVSADSILSAVHHSYDSILKSLELGLLSGELDALLSGMHQRLQGGAGDALDTATLKDADVFLSVARSLLAGRSQTTLVGGSQKPSTTWCSWPKRPQASATLRCSASCAQPKTFRSSNRAATTTPTRRSSAISAPWSGWGASICGYSRRKRTARSCFGAAKSRPCSCSAS